MTKPWNEAAATWNPASWKHRTGRVLPRRMHGEVGDRMSSLSLTNDMTCTTCGYHRCACREDPGEAVSVALPARPDVRIGDMVGYDVAKLLMREGYIVGWNRASGKVNRYRYNHRIDGYQIRFANEVEWLYSLRFTSPGRDSLSALYEVIELVPTPCRE